nr:cellulose synthase-like protein D5 [Ipomoea batatas]
MSAAATIDPSYFHSITGVTSDSFSSIRRNEVGDDHLLLTDPALFSTGNNSACCVSQSKRDREMEGFASIEGNSRGVTRLTFLVHCLMQRRSTPCDCKTPVLPCLAVDYPVEKVACYLSDDGVLLRDILRLLLSCKRAEFVGFLFAKKAQDKPRNPEAYFAQKPSIRLRTKNSIWHVHLVSGRGRSLRGDHEGIYTGRDCAYASTKEETGSAMFSSSSEVRERHMNQRRRETRHGSGGNPTCNAPHEDYEENGCPHELRRKGCLGRPCWLSSCNKTRSHLDALSTSRGRITLEGLGRDAAVSVDSGTSATPCSSHYKGCGWLTVHSRSGHKLHTDIKNQGKPPRYDGRRGGRFQARFTAIPHRGAQAASGRGFFSFCGLLSSLTLSQRPEGERGQKVGPTIAVPLRLHFRAIIIQLLALYILPSQWSPRSYQHDCRVPCLHVLLCLLNTI